MRVAVLLRSLAPGGAEKQALLLALALRDEHDVRLVVLSDQPRSPRHLAFLEEHGIEPTFLPAGWLRKPFALGRLLRRDRTEVLFGFLPSDTVVAALVGRLARVQRVYGGLRNSRMKAHKAWALRFVHNLLLDATISNSWSAVEHFAARGFLRRKLLVVPNGIFVLPPPAERRPSGTVRVLTVGRFVEEKDLRTALLALGLARDACGRSPRLRLSLAGSGPLEPRIRAWIAELDLAGSVDLVVDPPDTEALFREADVYLSTSRFEGLSNSILEAMNHGLPVVATDVGDNARLVEPGVDGALAAAGDARELARALVVLARSPELRRRYGAASHRLLEDRYSFETFKAAYAALVRGPDPERLSR